ncbi:MAG: hypothetical protein F4Z50_00740 [Gemmatimonadetes bacterium]|nr:hypothetical protein [Gemmatimonadota bacterium]MYD15187.1 hypothetical protein [Gemmatimonadota bacterium]
MNHARVHEARELDGLRRKYRIERTPEGRYHVKRLGLAYFPLTNEGIRAGMESEWPQFRWYLLDEVRTWPHAVAVASLHARGSGGFLPILDRHWKAVAA